MSPAEQQTQRGKIGEHETTRMVDWEEESLKESKAEGLEVQVQLDLAPSMREHVANVSCRAADAKRQYRRI